MDATSFEGVTAFTKMKKDAVDSPILAAAKAKRKVGGKSAKITSNDIVRAHEDVDVTGVSIANDETKKMALRRRAAKRALKERSGACGEKGTAVKDCMETDEIKGNFNVLVDEKQMKNQKRRAVLEVVGEEYANCVDEKAAGGRRLASHLLACENVMEKSLRLGDRPMYEDSGDKEGTPTSSEVKAAARMTLFEDCADCSTDSTLRRRLSSSASEMKKSVGRTHQERW